MTVLTIYLFHNSVHTSQISLRSSEFTAIFPLHYVFIAVGLYPQAALMVPEMGFHSYLKEKAPGCIMFQYMIHHQAMVGKNTPMICDSLDMSVKLMSSHFFSNSVYFSSHIKKTCGYNPPLSRTVSEKISTDEIHHKDHEKWFYEAPVRMKGVFCGATRAS